MYRNRGVSDMIKHENFNNLKKTKKISSTIRKRDANSILKGSNEKLTLDTNQKQK